MMGSNAMLLTRQLVIILYM